MIIRRRRRRVAGLRRVLGLLTVSGTGVATIVAATFSGAQGAGAAGTTVGSNPATLNYQCAFPATATHPITVSIAWSAGAASGSGLDSAVTFASIGVQFSGGLVDELRSLGAANVGGVVSPSLGVRGAPTALLAVQSLPTLPGSPLSVGGTWTTPTGLPPSFPFASGSPTTIAATSFVLQLASSAPDGSAVNLPASVTCTAPAGASNVIFVHTPRTCAPSETPAPPDSGDVCVPAPATPTPSPSASPTPTISVTPTPTASPSPTAKPTSSVTPTPATRFDFSVSGSVGVPTLGGSGTLTGGSLTAVASASGISTSVTLPTLSLQGSVFGFVPLRATAALTQAGDIDASLVAGQLSLNVPLQVALTSVKLLGVLPVTSGSCHTVTPSMVHLTSAGTFSPLAGGHLGGTFTIGAFTDCGPLLGVLNLLVPGSGNTVALQLTS